MRYKNSTINYELKLESTEASAGYFLCIPSGIENIENILEALEMSPDDEFMRRYALRKLAGTPEDDLLKMAGSNNPLLLSLLYETALTQSFLPALKKRLASDGYIAMPSESPLIYLKAHNLKDRGLHRKWVEIFAKNIEEHKELPERKTIELKDPVTPEEISGLPGSFTDIAALSDKMRNQVKSPFNPVPPEETFKTALSALEKLDIFHDIEMRHQSSLSPIALMRKWKMKINVISGRNDYTCEGIQTSYGKGLTLEAARASLYMEIAERCSSFASIGPDGVTGYTTDYPLTKARESELAAEKKAFLPPGTLGLEAPYENEPLYWIRGESPREDGSTESVLVPAQLVFLFCNLDEKTLFSGMSSTGLASGNTIFQARISAIMEAVERDAEATSPYNPAMCFELVASDPLLGPLLSAYRNAGISIRFQDITPESGIPCCKAFVTDHNKIVHKGTSASLNARKAIVSALTEVPWPFPEGGPTTRGLSGITRVDFDALPNYSTGNDEKDLKLIEKILASANLKPIYINLTRKDLNIPVVKAIIPGFCHTADLDSYSRISPGLFKNYMKMEK